MKKILLTFALFGAVLLGKAQVVFNEFYTIPATGESEFVEFYNSGAAVENVDAYVMVIWYDDGTNKGFYVLDLPSMNIAPKNVFVAAQALPLVYQAGTYTPPHPDSAFSWTNLGAYPPTSYLLDYRINPAGTGYLAPVAPANTNDLFQTLTGSTKYQIFLFKNGVIVNGLSVNGPNTLLPTIRSAPALSLADPDGAGPASAFTITWNATGTSVADNQIEYMGSAFGSANGAKRVRDGQCGAWEKSSSSQNHTPGRLNGQPLTTGLLPVTASMSCGIQNGSLTVSYSVSTGGDAAAYPVTIKVYEDLGRIDPGTTPNVNENLLPNGLFDAMDTVVKVDGPFAGASGTLTFVVNPIVSPTAYTFPWPGNSRDSRAFIVVFQTPAGCYDQIRFVQQCAILPIKLTAFTAKRQNTNVVLNWETAFENDNYGFEIQRKIGGGEFETIGFVVSQAANGTSYSDLDYSFTDINNTNKGVSQYRLKQIDLNAKTSLSDIRAVRGQGMAGKTIVFPNPTSNGKVSVVFEDAEGTRDVSVIDMAGRTIKQMKGVVTNNIQIENLTPGMYTLRVVVRETGEQVVEKIVVNKR